MTRLGVGVIGLGEVAQIIHLPILQQLSERYRIAAICDISPTLLDAMGFRYGVPADARHLDFHDLVARDDVDVVFVLNSDEYHAECAIAAATAGKHVLIEKPMALTDAEAEGIIRARDAAGVQVMVGYMRRFAPAFVRAVEEVKALEKITYVRVRDIIGQNRLFIEQSTNVVRPNDFTPEQAADRRARGAAAVREAIGDAAEQFGGTYRWLCGLSSHDLSAMRELIGVPQRVISATRAPRDGFMVIVFQYDGFTAILETGGNLIPRFDAHLEVYSPKTSIRIDYDSGYIRHLPTTLTIVTTDGVSLEEQVIRPT
ncbi:MAG TPA: Gfo/Idh/MocA family oxidoreductase, partial [Thermomicrobiales bacterium]|nr:Gfo/Idh/MocA family oxidoreductase [Thermomicrobiales bacterium]